MVQGGQGDGEVDGDRTALKVLSALADGSVVRMGERSLGDPRFPLSGWRGLGPRWGLCEEQDGNGRWDGTAVGKNRELSFGLIPLTAAHYVNLYHLASSQKIQCNIL